MTGLALAQIGEFSFVLAGVGRANGLLAGDIFQAFVASSILTILATPFLIQAGPALAARGERALPWKKRAAQDAARPACDLDGHVIIAGYGLNGRNLAHVLKEAGIGYFIIELNPVTVREAAAEGELIIFGDVSSRTILEEAGARRAKGIVFAISDPLVTRRGVKAVRELNPDLFIIVRTRYASEIDELLKLGADDVIPEEFETSIEIFTRVLEKYHVPRNIIDAQVKVLRGECYGMLRGSCSAVRPVAERIADLLAAGTAETYFVGQGAWPAGQTLGALDLRGRTGRDRDRRGQGRGILHQPGRGFRDQGAGHARPRRQPSRHRPGLPLSHGRRDGRGRGLRAEELSLGPGRRLGSCSSGPTGSGKTPLGEEIERRGLGGRRCVHFDFGATLQRPSPPPRRHGRGLAAAEIGVGPDLARDRRAVRGRDTAMIVKIVRALRRGRRRLAPGSLLVLNGLPRHPGQAEGARRESSLSSAWSISRPRPPSSATGSGSTRAGTGPDGSTTRSRRSKDGWPTSGSGRFHSSTTIAGCGVPVTVHPGDGGHDGRAEMYEVLAAMTREGEGGGHETETVCVAMAAGPLRSWPFWPGPRSGPRRPSSTPSSTALPIIGNTCPTSGWRRISS